MKFNILKKQKEQQYIHITFIIRAKMKKKYLMSENNEQIPRQ